MNKVLVNCNPSVLGFIGSGIVGLLPFLNSRLLFSRFEHVELWMVYLWMGGLFFVAMVISRYRRSRLRDIIISVSLGLPTALIFSLLFHRCLLRYPRRLLERGSGLSLKREGTNRFTEHRGQGIG